MSEAESTKKIFEGIKKKYGFVPNLLRELGERSPSVLNVYLSGNTALAESSLGPKALNAVMLAVSKANGCDYCTKAHCALLKGEGLSGGEIEAILGGKPLGDDYLDALVRAARIIHEKKGWVGDEQLADFAKAGVSRTQIYEIIAAIGLKTISNYVNHINKTKVDPVFLP